MGSHHSKGTAPGLDVSGILDRWTDNELPACWQPMLDNAIFSEIFPGLGSPAKHAHTAGYESGQDIFGAFGAPKCHYSRRLATRTKGYGLER